MANPIAVPGTVVSSGAAVSPGGAQGPTALSANANNKATLGTDSLLLVQGTAAGVAATTHAQTVSGDDPQLTNARTPTAHQASHVTGSDQIPLAGSSTKGLLNQTSGNTTDFIDGTNNSQALQPVIWSVRLRSFSAIGNPTFEVDQRTAGAGLVLGTGTLNGFGQDRWLTNKVGTMAGTVQQVGISPPDGVIPGTSFRITGFLMRTKVTTQQASLSAGDFWLIQQSVEGPNWRELSNDVHSVSLLVRSSVASLNFGLNLGDSGPRTKTLTKLCTTSATPNTWTLITLPNLPVWPAGNFTVTPGSIGYQFSICLAAGSTNIIAANDTWQSAGFGAVGQDNFFSKPVNSTFEMAYAGHEPGALCTTPIDCPFTQNYDACLRYFCKSFDYEVAPGTVSSLGCGDLFQQSTTSCYGVVRHPKPMAKIPTLTAYNIATGAANSIRLSNVTDYAVTGFNNNGKGGFDGITTATLPAVAAGVSARLHYTADTGW